MRARWIVVGIVVAVVGCSQMHKEKEAKEGDEVKMSINDIPAPARESLMKEAAGASITTVDKEMKDGKTVYEADAMVNGQNWEIIVDGDGKVVSKKVDEEKDEKKENQEKEENEKK
jgi:hypothetical protein